MGDLISRLSELRSQYSFFDVNERDAYHTLSEAIEALQEQKTGKWIPVSERIPEVNVLCCDRVGNIMFGYIFEDAGSDSGYSAVCSCDFLHEVVAWMPLPEPYKPQKSEDE